MHGSYRLNRRSVSDALIEILPDEPRWKHDAWVERALIGAVLIGGFVQAALAVF